MAAELEPTSKHGEGHSHFVNYVDLLRSKLQQKKVMYIADIVLKVEQVTLQQMLKWIRSDLVELLAEINNDTDNKHKIKVSHRNKFADTVIDIATRQKEALQKQTATTSQVKLLFLGKEEEDAIEAIQSGQQFMDQSLSQMKELLNNIYENKASVKRDLEKIFVSIKQRIDEKQKETISKIDGLYEEHLNKVQKRNEVLQESSKVVAKIYNDYESYFCDDKLTKADRKNKLVLAMKNIQREVGEIKKKDDLTYNMNIGVNGKSIDAFFESFLNLQCIRREPQKQDHEIDENENDEKCENELIVSEHETKILDSNHQYIFSKVIISPHGILTVNSWNPQHKVGGMLLIKSLGNVIIMENGKIELNGKGYCGGKECLTGESYNKPSLRQGQHNLGGGGGGGFNCYGGGGGYGTAGKTNTYSRRSFDNGGASYGDPKINILHLGSGGGGHFDNGGNGGGALKIECAHFENRGQILANGASGVGGGSGSGGSIFIKCDSFEMNVDNQNKLNNIIQACGGKNNDLYSGDGGDGRIRISKKKKSTVYNSRFVNNLINQQIQPTPFVG